MIFTEEGNPYPLEMNLSASITPELENISDFLRDLANFIDSPVVEDNELI